MDSETKSARSSIAVNGAILKILKQFREDLHAKLGGKITYNLVIQSLLQDRTDLVNLRKEMESIKKELEDTQTFIRDLLKQAISKPAQIIVGSSAPMIANPPPYSYGSPLPTNAPLPPPPPQPPSSPPIIKPNISMSADIRRDYLKEVTSVLTGETIKPSDLIQATQPDHSAAVIHEIDPSKIPDLASISHAEKNGDRFKRDHHEFTAIIPHADAEVADAEVVEPDSS